jgi:NAD(P)-dependent dehydrogenase (short-subunit alcohol dehydrogenase family)
MRLKNKHAVVIGGAIGIGQAITKRLAKEGSNLILTFHKDSEKEEAEKLKRIFEEYKINYSYEKLDVLNKDEIISFFKMVKSKVPGLDIAVNNAGVSTKNRFADITEEEWDFNMDINAKGMFLCCQEEAKIMMKQKKGKIVNTASIAGKAGYPLLAHYCASKFAVLGFTFAMAKELAEYNVNVNAVCPGQVYTDMIKREWSWEAKITGISRDKVIELAKKSIPLGRLAMPEDVADLVFFLASEDADYITGQAFNVDGGRENH